MKEKTIWAFGLISFVLLALLTIILAGGWIQSDLAERARTELDAIGQSWASIEINGRNAILAGTAPDAAAATQAMEAIGDVWGVRTVDDETSKP